MVLKVYLMSLKLFIPLSVNAYVGNGVVTIILSFLFFSFLLRKSSDIFLVAYVYKLNLHHDCPRCPCAKRDAIHIITPTNIDILTILPSLPSKNSDVSPNKGETVLNLL